MRLTYKSVFAAICVAYVALSVQSHGANPHVAEGAERPFNASDLLANEQVGKVALSPDGKRAAMVIIPSRMECARRRGAELMYYLDYIPEEACGEITVYSDGSSKRLAVQPGTLGFFAPQWSPSGRRLALLSFDVDGKAQIWVWDGCDLSRATERSIDPYLNIGSDFGWDLSPFSWLDDETLFAAVVTDDRDTVDRVPLPHPGATLIPAWRAQSSGTAMSASTLKSSVTQARLPKSTLSKLNILKGSVEEFSTGAFTALSISPNRDKALVLEAISNLQANDRDLFENIDQNIVPNGFVMGLSHSRVGVINLDVGGRGVAWLPSVYDPWLSPIGRRDLGERGAAFASPRPEWTIDGDRVAFVARQTPSVGASSKLFVYDFSRRNLEEIRTNKRAPLSIAWADGQLIYAQLAGGTDDEGCGSTWCIVDDEGGSHSAFDTNHFEAAAPNRLFRVGGALWFAANDQLWALDVANRKAVRLTEWEVGEVAAISSVSITGDSALVRLQGSPSHFHIIASSGGLAAQHQGVRTLPSPSASLKAFGGVHGIAVTEHSHSKGIDLSVQAASDAKAKVLYSLNRHLPATAPVHGELLSYEGRDGEQLTGVLLRSGEARRTRQSPLIVRVYPTARYSGAHQFENAKNSRLFLNDAMLPAQGYSVLYPTITISPPSEGGPLCDQFANDVLPAVEAAIASGDVDPDAVVLFGHSFGGYVVNSLMTCTDRFNAGIAVAGFSDIFESYWRLSPPHKFSDHAINADFGFHRAERSQQGVFNMGATPWMNPEIYIQNSPVFQADQLNAPLLLIHGEYDAVSIAHSEKMYMAGRRLGKDVTFVRYWGGGHMWRSPGNIRDFWDRIFAFLDEKVDEQ